MIGSRLKNIYVKVCFKTKNNNSNNKISKSNYKKQRNFYPTFYPKIKKLTEINKFWKFIRPHFS